MSTGRKLCTIIGSDKGGVGKSMISLVMALVFDNAGYPLRVVEIDNQRKLTSVLGADRIDLSLAAAPDLLEVSRNRHAAESFFNPVYLEWAKGDSVTDLGANVTTSLMAWFRQCEIGELAAEDMIDFRFVACASPDEQAIKSAVSALEEARGTLGPTAEYFVVLNDLSGSSGFAPYAENPSYRELRRLEAEGKVQVLEIPYCDSILLEHGKAMGLNPLQVVHQSDSVAAAAKLDPVGSRVHKRKMVVWLKETQASLAPLLTVEERQPSPGYAAA